MLTRFGLQIADFNVADVPDSQLFECIAGLATCAEKSGFDSLWLPDQLHQIKGVGAENDPFPESYTLLGALAARTERMRLGAMFSGVTYRNPALLAKMVTTLDLISSGRAVLAIGEAWRDNEHAAYGYDFPDVEERMDRLEEAIQLCRAMLTETEPTFEGRYYRINKPFNYPRPVTPGGPPILIPNFAEPRTLKVAAKYADAVTFFGAADAIRDDLAKLEKYCEEIGRDPAEISRIRLGPLIIAPTTKEAEHKWSEIRPLFYGKTTDDEYLRRFVIIGDPDSVAEQVSQRFAANLEGLVFTLPDAYNLDTVALAGETLVKHFGTVER
jgi:F420-dependent oxidoreductase-like protein